MKRLRKGMGLPEYLEARTVHEPNSGCWIWIGPWSEYGYGRFHRTAGATLTAAHRASYELHVGPIPLGYELDHRCRVPACINPAHLEPVTHRENMRRGHGFAGRYARATHCKSGHPLEGENLIIRTRAEGGRDCLLCQRDRNRRRVRRRSASSV